jgi:hypothetical protein
VRTANKNAKNASKKLGAFFMALRDYLKHQAAKEQGQRSVDTTNPQMVVWEKRNVIFG